MRKGKSHERQHRKLQCRRKAHNHTISFKQKMAKRGQSRYRSEFRQHREEVVNGEDYEFK